MSESALQALSAIMGILPEWHDQSGQRQTTGPETQRALLAAMGIAAASEAEAQEALEHHRAREAARRLPEEAVVTAGAEARVALQGAARWHLAQEDGAQQTGRAEGEIGFAVPPGLHRLTIEVPGGTERCLVIAAPPQAPGAAETLGRARDAGMAGWGMTAALYGLRSPRDLGLGDYADLGSAAAALGALGADFLGINPVHARGAACTGYSPYTPSCRTAFEPRHIAVDQAPGFAAGARTRAFLNDKADALARARAADLVDYGAVDALSNGALRQLFADFSAAGGRAKRNFERWRREEGGALEWFALFEAISLQHGADWPHWPVELRRFGAPAARAFAEANREEVRYHAWLQWLAARQLRSAQEQAKDAGMGLGLYLDVAVGVRPGGADTWSAPGCFALDVSLGAPPDAFNPAGQNWALAPFSPPGLSAARYRPFIEMLRAAMNHAGMIRIDHILSVRRAFWVPQGGEAGGYVGYPEEALLALIRLEAWRAGCVVVGEDLGSVPPGFREDLAGSGLLGCAVMQFEKDIARFHRPQDYRAKTLASFATHDTPTLRGWWRGWDIETRHAIGGGEESSRQAALAERGEERRGLARLLRDEGLAPEGLDPESPPGEADDALAAAVHRLLARAASPLVAVQLDDALGHVGQQNLPGTTDEHPNWRRRYAVEAEALAALPGLKALAETLSPAAGTATASSGETQPWP